MLLAASRNGDSLAADRLFQVLYDDLRRLAARTMQRERPDHTLDPTALVHEAYMRLIKSRFISESGASEAPTNQEEHAAPAAAPGRAQFIAVAAVVMRRVLVNHAIAKRATKRGGAATVLALDEGEAVFVERAIDLVALDEALKKLALLDPAQARLVELRFFGGMSMNECADALGISVRKAHYEWMHARAWLRATIDGS